MVDSAAAMLSTREAIASCGELWSMLVHAAHVCKRAASSGSAAQGVVPAWPSMRPPGPIAVCPSEVGLEHEREPPDEEEPRRPRKTRTRAFWPVLREPIGPRRMLTCQNQIAVSYVGCISCLQWGYHGCVFLDCRSRQDYWICGAYTYWFLGFCY